MSALPVAFYFNFFG